jgi:hypothetical protein
MYVIYANYIWVKFQVQIRNIVFQKTWDPLQRLLLQMGKVVPVPGPKMTGPAHAYLL